MAMTKAPYGTDDELYRVDAVWLGPPHMTFPWHARYISWAVGLVVFLIAFAAMKAVFGFSFFTAAWAAVLTAVLTRWIGKKITHERPFGAVFVMAIRELTTPRLRTKGTEGSTTLAHVRFRATRPTPAARRTRRHARRTPAARTIPANSSPNSSPRPWTPAALPPAAVYPPSYPPHPHGRGATPIQTTPQNPPQWPAVREPDRKDQLSATPPY
jgi:hypothetical protein